MVPSSAPGPPVAAIVTYLFTQRESILNTWRTVCEQDPALNKVLALSREEFNNLLPVILDILEKRLLGQEQGANPTDAAQAHGLHRWQKAFTLRETMSELYHLTQILYRELSLFQELFPQTGVSLLLQVHRQIAQLMHETIDGSVVKYYDLHSLEAAQRTSTLQQALDQMADLNRQRGDMLRTSSHDLKGSLGIISGAASMLKLDGLPQEQRDKYLAMLSRNLNNVQSMLGSLMDLARLEAGEETLQIQSIDVAPLLRELVGNAQGLATERGLLLRADGPAPLLVQTDPLKLQRIVQNLLLNALKYTPAGFISVSWSTEDHARWMFSIQDSGPGLPSGLASIFGEQLRPTVEATSVLSPSESEPVAVLPVDVPKLPTGAALDQPTNHSPKGEGVGLQIVKRLCELLGASLEIESVEGRGTLFRIRMPIQHK